jgi:hypothetical protein
MVKRVTLYRYKAILTHTISMFVNPLQIIIQFDKKLNQRKENVHSQNKQLILPQSKTKSDSNTDNR